MMECYLNHDSCHDYKHAHRLNPKTVFCIQCTSPLATAHSTRISRGVIEYSLQLFCPFPSHLSIHTLLFSGSTNKFIGEMLNCAFNTQVN